MSSAISTNIGSAATAVTFTSLNSLASSATVGCQTAPITLVDGSNNVPLAVDFFLTIQGVGSGTVANDKCVYIWFAQSIDGTNFEYGPPVLGSSDAAYTFTTAPGTTAPPWIGAATAILPANSSIETVKFTLLNPPAKVIAIVLNYSGVALHASANSLTYRSRFGNIA